MRHLEALLHMEVSNEEESSEKSFCWHGPPKFQTPLQLLLFESDFCYKKLEL